MAGHGHWADCISVRHGGLKNNRLVVVCIVLTCCFLLFQVCWCRRVSPVGKFRETVSLTRYESDDPTPPGSEWAIQDQVQQPNDLKGQC